MGTAETPACGPPQVLHGAWDCCIGLPASRILARPLLPVSAELSPISGLPLLEHNANWTEPVESGLRVLCTAQLGPRSQPGLQMDHSVPNHLLTPWFPRRSYVPCFTSLDGVRDGDRVRVVTPCLVSKEMPN